MAGETIGAEAAAAPGEADAPVLATLDQVTMNAFERSGLDPETYLLTRIAALVAMDRRGPGARSWPSPLSSAVPAW
ncbi:hypothetical protein OG873_23155 [Streptomyces violaceus]|uniref:hypothetical protein n=1 Tax=Streptomyces violaceus TaxID=1936 RepID=UPI002E29A58A|nr:hypothetical protein [Streptomyces violaceus]